MIFLVSQDPFSALQLQSQLKLTGLPPVEIFLSVEETENNLYKLPDIVLIDENLSFPKLLALTQSVKGYNAQLKVIWLCEKDRTALQKIYQAHGAAHCIPKDELLLDSSLVKVHILLQHAYTKRSRQQRMEFLKKNLLSISF